MFFPQPQGEGQVNRSAGGLPAGAALFPGLHQKAALLRAETHVRMPLQDRKDAGPFSLRRAAQAFQREPVLLLPEVDPTAFLPGFPAGSRSPLKKETNGFRRSAPGQIR